MTIKQLYLIENMIEQIIRDNERYYSFEGAQEVNRKYKNVLEHLREDIKNEDKKS